MIHFPCFKIKCYPSSILVEPSCTYVIEDKTKRSEARIIGVLEFLVILGYLVKIFFDGIGFIVINWGNSAYS